jgi:hypothetical protein
MCRSLQAWRVRAAEASGWIGNETDRPGAVLLGRAQICVIGWVRVAVPCCCWTQQAYPPTTTTHTRVKLTISFFPF